MTSDMKGVDGAEVEDGGRDVVAAGDAATPGDPTAAVDATLVTDGAANADAAPDDPEDAGSSLCSKLCAGPTPHCDESTDRCLACTNDDHCWLGSQRCFDGVCADCVTDLECQGLRRSHCLQSECVECVVDANCGVSREPYCVNRACVGCRSATDCAAGGGGSMCIAGTCGNCKSSADCRQPALSRCSVRHRCEPCQADADCAGQRDAAGRPLALCVDALCVQMDDDTADGGL